MKTTIFVLFLIILSPSILAAGISPTSMIYFLEPNQELCQLISLDSNSSIVTLSDVWAENEFIDRKVALFNTTASEHHLTLNYPHELSTTERDIEVCISGSEIGKYHGAIIIRQGQEGNSVLQLVVHLEVLIEQPTPETQPQTETPISSGGGGGGGSGKVKLTVANKTSDKTEQNSPQDVELLSQQAEQTNAGQIPEADSQQTEKQNVFTLFRMIPFLFIIGLVIAAVFVRKKRNSFIKPK
jgi:hypothetical protein